MLGSAFRGTLREAQAGDEQAFTRLWRDANPLVVRYLRVVGADDPYDAACEGWLTAVRGLTGFTGDEDGWRVWLLACARLRAEEDSERQRWASVTPIDRRAFSSATRASSAASAAAAGAASILAMRHQDDGGTEVVFDSSPDTDPEQRGLADTVTALRALPLGQGEILVLRLGGRLSVGAVSDVVGSDMETVRRSETRALERLGTSAELISWSLDAPANPAELADERVALGAFRSIPRPPAWSVPRTRVVTVGPSPSRRKDGHAPRGIANAAGRSRTALLGIAAVSASVMSLGGLSAAAYVGALPAGVQQVMHETIGAPEPGAGRKDHRKRTPAPTGTTRPGAGLPSRTDPAASVKGRPNAPTAQVGTTAKDGGKPSKPPGSSPTSATSLPVLPGAGVPSGDSTSPAGTTKAPPRTPSTKPAVTKTPGGNATRTKPPTTKAPRTKAPSTGKGAGTESTPSPVSTAEVSLPGS